MNERAIRSLRPVGAALLLFLLASASAISATGINVEKLPLSEKPGVTITPVMVNEIEGVAADLVSIVGRAQHTEPAHPDVAVVWLVVAGQGSMRTHQQTYFVAEETIARAPQGWEWNLSTGKGQAFHLLRIRRALSPGDLEELKKFPQFQEAPHVKRFLDCPAYGEAIKSAKTTSRTLLPENYIPRMAMGTVETTGPDEVGAHRHPMLEQLFLGLHGNDITVTADDAHANLPEYTILHIPLGSNHGASVTDGKKLHYVWMDFFITKEGQEWLQMHKPLEPEKP